MKFLAVCTILAAIATLTFAKPAQETTGNATDWEAVSVLIVQIELTVRQGGQEVIDIAVGNNETVGNTIAGKIRATGDVITVIFQQLSTAASAQTLTDIEATGFLGQVRGNMAKLLGSLELDFLQLSALTEIMCRNVFENVFDKIAADGEILIALLLV